jgi:hypothetical protein
MTCEFPLPVIDSPPSIEIEMRLSNIRLIPVKAFIYLKGEEQSYHFGNKLYPPQAGSTR